MTPRRPVRGPWLLVAVMLGAVGSAHAGDRTGDRTGDRLRPTAGAWDLPPHRATVFINFDGGPMTTGSNAAEGQANCFPDGDKDVKPWSGSPELRAEIVERVREGMAPFGVRVVDERPPKHLPYSQVMVIGIEGPGPSMTCSVDCGDQWRRDTGYVMPWWFGEDADRLASAALNVIGRNAGLDFTADESLYSNIYVLPGPRTWGDECTALYADAPQSCVITHEKLCGEGTQLQNDVAELTAVFGENSVDTVAPTVKLLAPVDGMMFASGASVEIEVEVSDDFGGVGWRLMLPDLGEEVPAYKDETSWSLALPDGAHVVRVEAIDHDRNIGAAEVTVYVGVEAPADPTTTGDTTTGATTGEDPTGEDPTSEATTTGDAPTGGPDAGSGTGEQSEAAGDDDKGDAGCTCRTDAARPGAWLSLGLLVTGLARRRRRTNR